MTTSLHRLALQELVEAAAFYDAQSPGLGEAFITAVEEALDFVARHPLAAPLAGENTRRLVMAGFPYNIVYSVMGGEARVLAIAHQRRTPAYWLGRS